MKEMRCDCEFKPIMVEIGGVGKDYQFCELDENGKIKAQGVREIILYQCPTCKTIKLS